MKSIQTIVYLLFCVTGTAVAFQTMKYQAKVNIPLTRARWNESSNDLVNIFNIVNLYKLTRVLSICFLLVIIVMLSYIHIIVYYTNRVT